MFMAIMSFSVISSALTLSGFKAKTLTPTTGVLTIPTKDISDDGTKVIFFVLKSSDGVIRAAIDACDVCYRSGKGYVQDGDYMVCTNCGRRFASNRINDVKGGCNPAPLDRKIVANNIMISMADINKNSWYCEYK
ncbi:MAG: DUF2318 domain-containing protein [Deltaproteobacteria bacterium]|nr:DUF2318 domain-containing protein [Deltaproteobacteria bacterium]